MDVPARTSRPSAGQRALAETIVRGEAPAPRGVVELDASVYIDPLRFEREKRAVFDKLPLLLGPSALRMTYHYSQIDEQPVAETAEALQRFP